MGIVSVVGYSDADRKALFVQQADEAYYLGPDEPAASYLNVQSILSAARQAGAQAVHPGYGFLAENEAFATAVQEAELTFIGPTSSAIRLMGDKVRARAAASALGVPVVPGTPKPVGRLEEALTFARDAGYPVAVKAAGGGGGRGIRVVWAASEMEEALDRARREAAAYFKNPEVYLERYFLDPRHVEVQILGDQHGHLVHLGERDCSIQRRHQKLLEESPSPAVDPALRKRMGDMALRVASSVGYTSAGTVEFLLSREGDVYFLEMNTRIQVEHPVTEEVVPGSLDLLREMVLAAAREPISIQCDVLEPQGHAIEVRINAEDPGNGFRPTPTAINRYREPGGIGVRVDSGVYEGYTIPRNYDSLMAKLIVRASNREGARIRALRALGEFQVTGPATTIPFSESVIRHPQFAAGEAGTTFVENHLEELIAGMRETASSRMQAVQEDRSGRTFEVEVNRKLFHVRVSEVERDRRVTGARRKLQTTAPTASDGAALVSPMHGTVIAVRKQPGEGVHEGEVIFIIEAMKMENEVPAHRTGTLSSIDVQIGDTVETGQQMGSIE